MAPTGIATVQPIGISELPNVTTLATANAARETANNAFGILSGGDAVPLPDQVPGDQNATPCRALSVPLALAPPDSASGGLRYSPFSWLAPGGLGCSAGTPAKSDLALAIGAFAAQSQIAHPIEPAILDRAEQRRPVGAGLDWLAPVAGHGTGADHEVRRSQFAKHRGQRSCQATESRGQRDPAQPRGDQQLQNLPGQITWLGQEGSRRLRLDAGPAFPQGRL